MQQISVVTLGIADLARSRRFYVDGFGWAPVFENEEILFYQMNGFVFGTWLKQSLDKDMQDSGRAGASSFALAHNVLSEAEVKGVIDRLVAVGGSLMRPADAPPHGGYRGYVADPDGHTWEIAFNPAWPIDERGMVTFGL
jgi:catechol 2,3-dioxygenase-like lactoylglutathione lyase family enzyme